MSEDIYTKFGIDKSKLKRDYQQNPIKITKNGKGSESLSKEELEYLFIDLNLSVYDIKNVIQVENHRCIERWLSKNNIKKSPQLWTLKVKQSKMEKYGDEYFFNKDKIKQTCLEKYNVEFYFQSQQYKNLYKNKKFVQNKIKKEYETKKNNNNYLWNSSKPEKYILQMLKQKYPQTIYQYMSVEYPFACDFYIPEIDTYIEYQGFWTHGKEPYIGTDKQKEKLKLWESKNTPQYNKAIDDWTNRDVLKRKTAQKNNLNWLEFFSFTEFEEWFNKK